MTSQTTAKDSLLTQHVVKGYGFKHKQPSYCVRLSYCWFNCFYCSPHL